MAKSKSATVQISTFADHHIITQPNPLRNVLRRVAERDLDDPVARAEKALAGLSGEFKSWMVIEADRLSDAESACAAPLLNPPHMYVLEFERRAVCRDSKAGAVGKERLLHEQL